MKNILSIGGIAFHIESVEPISFEPAFDSFFDTSRCTGHVHVQFIWSFSHAPTEFGNYLGSDVLQSYYKDGTRRFSVLAGGKSGPVALTEYEDSFDRFTCYVNTEAYPYFPRTFGNLLRALPIRALFQHHRVLFFHAAQIALGDTGILFTAPSGTGKTTQARLWRDHRDARIICNDRTLIRDGRTYGFPIDGSEPVRSGEVHRLAAIVILTQAPENSVQRLRPRAALARLLPQLVIDGWDSDAQKSAGDHLVQLLSRCPVYQLNCTPDNNAVACLEAQLAADGVIK